MARILTPAVLALSLFAAGAAFADDDDCRSPMSQWQPKDAAARHVADLGIDIDRLRTDDGCYEVRGRDRDGNRVELKLDPATLALMKLDVEFRSGADPSRYLAGARGMQAAPGQAQTGNPLFTPGTTPQVNGN